MADGTLHDYREWTVSIAEVDVPGSYVEDSAGNFVAGSFFTPNPPIPADSDDAPSVPVTIDGNTFHATINAQDGSLVDNSRDRSVWTLNPDGSLVASFVDRKYVLHVSSTTSDVDATIAPSSGPQAQVSEPPTTSEIINNNFNPAITSSNVNLADTLSFPSYVYQDLGPTSLDLQDGFAEDTYSLTSDSGPQSGAFSFQSLGETTAPSTTTSASAVTLYDAAGDPLSLTPDQEQALQAGFSASTSFSATDDGTGHGSGSVGWTYNPDPGQLSFLVAGQTASVQEQIDTTDQYGQTTSSTVDIDVHGDENNDFKLSAGEYSFLKQTRAAIAHGAGDALSAVSNFVRTHPNVALNAFAAASQNNAVASTAAESTNYAELTVGLAYLASGIGGGFAAGALLPEVLIVGGLAVSWDAIHGTHRTQQLINHFEQGISAAVSHEY